MSQQSNTIHAGGNLSPACRECHQKVHLCLSTYGPNNSKCQQMSQHCQQVCQSSAPPLQRDLKKAPVGWGGRPAQLLHSHDQEVQANIRQ